MGTLPCMSAQPPPCWCLPPGNPDNDEQPQRRHSPLSWMKCSVAVLPAQASDGALKRPWERKPYFPQYDIRETLPWHFLNLSIMPAVAVKKIIIQLRKASKSLQSAGFSFKSGSILIALGSVIFLAHRRDLCLQCSHYSEYIPPCNDLSFQLVQDHCPGIYELGCHAQAWPHASVRSIYFPKPGDALGVLFSKYQNGRALKGESQLLSILPIYKAGWLTILPRSKIPVPHLLSI